MNIGIVLAGGMAKGAYQVGALKAIKELIPKEDIKCISASSIGVLNGYAFANDRLDEVEQLWRNIEYEGNRTFVNRILKSSYLQKSIAGLCSKGTDIKTPFYATLFNLRKNTVCYHDISRVSDSNIPLYLKASVAMPIYNKSVLVEDEYYYDGGIGDNIPVFPIVRHNLDYIICIYFDACTYTFENHEFDRKILKLTFSNSDVLKENLVLTHSSVERMLATGYELTKRALQGVVSVGDDKRKVYEIIKNNNFCSGYNSNLRITGDMLVSNLNKVTRKLSRRKIFY